MKFSVKIYFLLVLVVFINACTVQKRSYRNGYHVEWAGKKSKTNTLAETNTHVKTTENPEDKADIVVVKPIQDYTEANTLNKFTENKSPVKSLLTLKDTCGDVITFKSGDIIKAKVYEITDDKIKYKRCDNLNGPMFIVSKNTVHSIFYTNGVEEIIMPPEYSSMNPATNNTYRGPQKVHPYAVWAILAATIGILLSGLGPIVGLLLANIAIKEITANPKRYKGLLLAKIARYISIVLLILMALVVLLVLIALLSVI